MCCFIDFISYKNRTSGFHETLISKLVSLERQQSNQCCRMWEVPHHNFSGKDPIPVSKKTITIKQREKKP